MIKCFVATTVRRSLTLQSHCVQDVTVSLKKEGEAELSRKEWTGMGTSLQVPYFGKSPQICVCHFELSHRYMCGAKWRVCFCLFNSCF